MFACITMLVFVAVEIWMYYPRDTALWADADEDPSRLNPLRLWRFVLCLSMLSCVVLLAVYLSYPDTNWKTRLRAAMEVSALPALLVGWIWQWRSHESLYMYLRQSVIAATLYCISR